MKRFLKYFFLFLLFFFVSLIIYFFSGRPQPAENIIWGVNFSQKHAEKLGLDWKKTYLALLDDLQTKNIKVAAYWDLIEQEKGEYNFDDLDWQIKQAKEHQAKVLLVVGMKTPRWPECHIPDWAKNLNKEEQQERILELIKTTVLRYRWSDPMPGEVVWAWQVENEPLFPFGECPWTDKDFLKKEISLVNSLDIAFESGGRPIIISDSGEGSLWFTAAQLGDIVATTMYRKVWFKEIKNYLTYPFPPSFYWKKAQIIKKLFHKKVIVGELQAEPWGPNLLYNLSLEEQEKSMNLGRFKDNIAFAKKTGFDEFYLWGAEWWYWLKEKQQRPEIWEEARSLFKD